VNLERVTVDYGYLTDDSASVGDEMSVTNATIKRRLNLEGEIASMRSLSDLRADDGLHWHQALLDRVSINSCRRSIQPEPSRRAEYARATPVQMSQIGHTLSLA
jgi:hypothetical protein